MTLTGTKSQILSVVTLLLLGLATVEDSYAQKSTKEKLFNGENLDGWYTFLRKKGVNNDPDKVFSVSNKTIRISGEEYGCITTEKEYENYKLTVEYKWGTKTHPPRLNKAKDSGILVHSQGRDGGYAGVWITSIECQIIEGGTGDILVVGDSTERFSVTSPVSKEKQGESYVFKQDGDFVTILDGRINWFGRDPNWQDIEYFRGANDVEKHSGGWNRVDLIADGDKINIYLNGVLVNQAMRVRPSKGKIQIQSEGAEMFVRKVDLEFLYE